MMSELPVILLPQRKYSIECPKCANSRSKHSTKSLTVFRDSDGYVRWVCNHAGQCEWNERQFMKDPSPEDLGPPSSSESVVSGITEEPFTVLGDDPVYWYKDLNNVLLYGVRRTANKVFLPIAWTGTEWTYEKGTKYPSFKAFFNPGDDLKTSSKVLVVEGEKTAIAAKKLFPEVAVVTWRGGANNLNTADWRLLNSKSKVYLWPDNDAPGKSAMETISNLIVGPAVFLVNPSQFFEGADLADDLDMDAVVKCIRDATMLSQSLDSSAEEVRQQAEELNHPRLTGYEVLDNYISFPQSGVIVLEARTKHGKSALAVNFADRYLASGGTVHYFSYEIPASHLLGRFVRVHEPENTVAEYLKSPKWEHYLAKLQDTLVIYDTSRQITIDKLSTILDSPKYRGSMVVIDYCQIVPIPRRLDRQLAIKDMMDTLRVLANKHGFLILLLSQLTPDYSNPLHDTPREAKDIHFSADMVLRGWYKDYELPHPMYETLPGNYVLHVLLNRHGPAGFQFGAVLHLGSYLEFNEEVSNKIKRNATRETTAKDRLADAVERIANLLEPKDVI